MSSAEPKVEKEAGPPAEVATPPAEEEKKKREYKDFGHDDNKGPTRKSISLYGASEQPAHIISFPDALVDMSQVRHQFLGV